MAFCKSGRVEDMQDMIKKNSNYVTLKDPLGNTGVHYAAHGNHSEAVAVLLNSKSDPNARNNVGDTALHQSAPKSNKEVIEILIKSGADLMIKNNDGKIAQEYAKDVVISDLLAPSIESRII